MLWYSTGSSVVEKHPNYFICTAGSIENYNCLQKAYMVHLGRVKLIEFCHISTINALVGKPSVAVMVHPKDGSVCKKKKRKLKLI